MLRIESQPMSTSIDLLQTALAHHRAGKRVEAESGYRSVLQVDAEQIDAHHLLGVLLFETGRTEESLQYLAKATTLNPQFADAHYNLARAMAVLNRAAEAIESYGQAIRCRPSFVEAYFNLGNLFRDLGRTDEAIASFRQAIEGNPRYAKAYTNLAHLLLPRDIAQAVRCYQSAVAIQPGIADVHVNLAIALRQSGDLTAAQASLDQAIR